MEQLVGRIQERKILEKALAASGAELIAMYGRRRIGKTFLIRSVYEKYIRFEFTGVHNATMPDQLEGFSFALKKAINSPVDIAVPKTWVAAFHLLENILEPLIKKGKAVIFFDEFPWIHTQKSNFLKAFEHFWNDWASKHANLKVVICGSAASWMIRNIVNNKGGLHNRVTIRMRLLPFTLSETQEYLKSRSVKLDHYQLLQLYMAIGGVPQYLKAIQKGESATQAIDRLFFTKDGTLKDEFKILYESLYENAASHIAVIRLLYEVGKGMTRNEIIRSSHLSSGGTTTNVLTELEESGFVASYIPFDKTSKELVYRLTDEYSLFYLKFIERSRATGTNTWLRISEGNSFKSWSGYAFESICLKHLPQIKKALHIENIYTEESVWRHVPGKGKPGAQIDLLLDRKDRCINICEIKFATDKFTIVKKYADELIQKQTVFVDKTKNKKTIFLTMITTYGVTKNNYYKNLVQSEVTMDVLFD
ncbi:MAG: AAA family ATPase [Chitinophagaceae bacterium]